jgi:hypothetical protein
MRESSTAQRIRARVPHELQTRSQWLCWREEKKEGRPTRVPYEARTGRLASSTDPATWTTLSFGEWVVKQEGRSGPVGDLAHDAAGDATWPTDRGTIRDYWDYMCEEGACDAALECLAHAWHAYTKYVARFLRSLHR